MRMLPCSTVLIMMINSFDNHDFSDKGISKLCLVNELE